MPSRPLEPGDPVRLGRFELLGRLGGGGQGVVYLGRGSLRYTPAHCFSAAAVARDTLAVGDQDGVVHGIRLPAGPGSRG